MSLSLKELQKLAEDILPHTHSKKSSKDAPIIAGTGGKTNYRVLPNLRFAYAMPLVLLVAGVGIYSLLFTQAAPTDTANLWIDNVTPAGSCQRSANATTYNHSTACSSMSAAISASRCAANPDTCDTIRMLAGNYSNSQTIGDKGTNSTNWIKSSPGVKLIAEPGTNVTSISFGRAAWIELQNIHNTGSMGWEDIGKDSAGIDLPHDLKFTNVDAGAGGYWDGGKNITWKGGKIGPFTWRCDPVGSVKCGSAAMIFMQGVNTDVPAARLSDVVLDGLTFSGMRIDESCLDTVRPDGDDCHVEVIRLDEGTKNITLKNSTFTDNQVNTALVFTGSYGPGLSVDGFTIENNFFGDTIAVDAIHAPSAALDASNGCRNLNIRHNTWKSTMNLSGCTQSTTNVTVTGNLGNGTCGGSGGTSTFVSNVWTGSTHPACSTSDIGKQSISFASDGLHLPDGSSPAKDFIPAANCTVTTDHDGGSRPFPTGGKCDAGAHEYGSTPTEFTPLLWVDDTGGSCTRSVTYETTKACTWSSAYNNATSGETINVKGGSYGNVSMPTNDGTAMTYKAVSGESIVLSGLEWRASPTGQSQDNHGPDNVTVIGPMKIGPTSIDGVTNTIFDNIDFDAGGGTSRAVQGDMPNTVPSTGANLTIKNSKLHNTVEANSMVYFSGAKLVFDNNEFYDALINSGSDTHTECLFLWSTKNVTLSRNHFWDCDAEGVFVSGSATWPDAIVENNVFEIVAGSAANASSGLAFRNGGAPSPYPTNILLRYNTFMSGVQTPDSTSGATGNVYGNYFRLTPMTGWGSIVYGCNVTSSGPTTACRNTNASDFTSNLINAGFTNPVTTQGNGTPSNKAPKGDYTLKSNSPFIDLVGSPNTYPTLDLLGITRYKGIAPDLGAYESNFTGTGTDTTPPVTTLNTTATGTPASSTTSTSATFTFSANEASTFQCKLDTAAYASCSSPKAYTGLTVGSHTFSVKATDTAGNTEATAKTYSWTITSSTSTCPTKAGDVNGDGSVNITDIGLVLSAYGQSTTTNCADLDKSGSINIQDLSIILSKYGS